LLLRTQKVVKKLPLSVQLSVYRNANRNNDSRGCEFSGGCDRYTYRWLEFSISLSIESIPKK